MNLDRLCRRDRILYDLMQQAAYWQRLDGRIKALLPANLHDHFQVACIDGGTLVIRACHNMAASRLRMIAPVLLPQMQAIDGRIRQVRIKIEPPQQTSPPQKQARLSENARQQCRQTAARLEHHPQLAAALRRLAQVADR